MQRLEKLLADAEHHPDTIDFSEVMAVIEECYQYQPCAFSNGESQNEAGSNEGSCKIFALARIHKLGVPATLALFGRFYREDVLGHPDGSDHANIRTFMKSGWDGISFDGEPLTSRG